MNCAPNGTETVFALKQVNLPVNWWQPWITKDAALWHEGACLADWEISSLEFHHRAEDTNTKLYGMSFIFHVPLSSFSYFQKNLKLSKHIFSAMGAERSGLHSLCCLVLTSNSRTTMKIFHFAKIHLIRFLILLTPPVTMLEFIADFKVCKTTLFICGCVR